MKWFLLILTLSLLTQGFQKAKPHPVPPSKKSAPTLKQTKESGLNNASPQAAWRSLLKAMHSKDEKKIRALTTPAGMKCLIELSKSAGDDSAILEFLQAGASGLSKAAMRWEKQTKDRAEGRIGPQPKESAIYFKKTPQGWKFDELIPGD
jgi:hypothetical protein